MSLPFHVDRVVEGWQRTSIVTSNTGQPLTVADGFDFAGFGYVPTGAPRPNYVPGCTVAVGTVNRWFNPACFTIGVPGTFGNVGRNTITGPGLAEVDFARIKDTRIRESLRLQFRAEFFNIVNHPQFGQPNTPLFTAERWAPARRAARVAIGTTARPAKSPLWRLIPLRARFNSR